MASDGAWGDNIHPIRSGVEPSSGKSSLDENENFAQSPHMSTYTPNNSESETKGWSFLTSPQFSVIVSTIVVLVAGAAMYSSLESKLEAVRLEGKADIQLASDRTGSDVDKIALKIDKVDDRFQAILNKMDADGREMRSLILSGQHQEKTVRE